MSRDVICFTFIYLLYLIALWEIMLNTGNDNSTFSTWTRTTLKSIFTREKRSMLLIGKAKGLIQRNNRFWSELGLVSQTRDIKNFIRRVTVKWAVRVCNKSSPRRRPNGNYIRGDGLSIGARAWNEAKMIWIKQDLSQRNPRRAFIGLFDN